MDLPGFDFPFLGAVSKQDTDNTTIEQEVQKDSLDNILPLIQLREKAKDDLINLLSTHRNNKFLIIDPNIMNLFQQILFPNNSVSLSSSNTSQPYIPIISLLESSSLLKSQNVSKIFEVNTFNSDTFSSILSNTTTSSSIVPERILYFIRPHLSTMRIIIKQIQFLISKYSHTQFFIYFIPSKCTICMHLLEELMKENKISSDRILFKSFDFGFIPIDSDLLTLDINETFKQCYVDGDFSSLNIIAQSLLKLQNIYGIIPNIKCKGVASKRILQRMMHIRVDLENNENEFNSSSSSSSSSTSNTTSSSNLSKDNLFHSEIDTMILLDREIDLYSPLITPLTYEGLVDHMIGINNSKIVIESSVLGTEENNELESNPFQPSSNTSSSSSSNTSSSSSSNELITLLMNDNDSIFSEIRNLSIEKLGSYMQEKALNIRERYAAFKNNRDASLAEIHDFVKKIPKLTKDFKSLNQHIHIAEMLKNKTNNKKNFRDYYSIEKEILEGENLLDLIENLLYIDIEFKHLNNILKLLCLQSLTSNGIRSNKYENIRKLIIQNYGYKHLFTLNNLEKCGLIKRKEGLLDASTTIWYTLKKQLKLLDDNVNMMNPNDISYVSGGYAPLLVRLIQLICKSNLNNTNLIEALRLLPGPFLQFVQPYQPEELLDILAKANNDALSGSSQPTTTSSLNFLANTDLNIFKKETSNDESSSNINSSNNSQLFVSNFLLDDPTVTKKTMLVVLIGGISFLEIAALRYLSNDPKFPYKIIIASTKIINGDTFLQSLHHQDY